MAERQRLERLWAEGRAFLGTDLAVMGGAMSWISERNLVAAISNAGGFGVLACGSMEPERLGQEIDATRILTDKPFGVNLIVMHPQLDDLIRVCGDRNVSHIVLAGGVPSGTMIAQAKETSAKVLCFAPALVLAKKFVRSKVDALIIEGTEAGGHIGAVATGVLAQEILPVMSEILPVFVAGGIGRGESIVSYLEMGGAGVQLGTRFVCAQECIAHPNFKKAFIRAAARDAVPTVQVDPAFPVIPVRALVNEGTRRFVEFQHSVIRRHREGELDHKAAQLEIEHYWAGALRRAVIDGDVEKGSLMAGQSVGLVTREQTCVEIFAELMEQAVRALAGRR